MSALKCYRSKNLKALLLLYQTHSEQMVYVQTELTYTFFSNVKISQILINRLTVLRYTENLGKLQLCSSESQNLKFWTYDFYALTPGIYSIFLKAVLSPYRLSSPDMAQ